MYEFPPLPVRIALAVCLYAFLAIAYRELYRTVKQTRPPGSSRRIRELAGSGLGARTAPKLVVVSAGESSRARVGEAFALLATNTLGRGPENSIVLADQWVSKRHARIDFDGQRFFLSDEGSTNGSFVDGGKTEGAHELRPGARLQLGTTTLEYQE